MTAPTGSGFKRLFQEALDLSASERERFLADLAVTDPAAHERVVQLLRAHEQSAGLDEIRLARPAAPSGPPPPGAGTRIGSCTLLEPIGSGGSGVVWRARRDTAGRLVALKILRAGRFASAGERRRFCAEAEIVARLDHPGIVPLYGVGEHEGSPWFTMKLIEGPSLTDELERGPLPPRRAAALLEYWENDPNTRQILLYLEAFGDPERFMTAARRGARRRVAGVTRRRRSWRFWSAGAGRVWACAASGRCTEARR